MIQPFPEIPGYTLKKELGSGGFGTSYLAHSDRDQSLCVIKQLSLQRLKDWKSLELFEREARTLAQLKHPQIPRFIDYLSPQSDSQVGSDPPDVYLIQAYAPGIALQTLVEQGTLLGEEKVLKLAIEIAEILVYLQGLIPPVIHRDIKPGNIIIDEDQAYLIDFGAVRDSMKQQGSSTVVGTFGYMAPEQFQGRAYPATDIYGLGTTLLYALSHKQPHEMNSTGLALDIPPDLEISKGFRAVLKKMLAPETTSRYTCAKDLIEDLKALQSGKVPGVLFEQIRVQNEALSSARSPAKRKVNKPLLLVGIVLLVFVIVSWLRPQTQMPADRERYDAIKHRLEKTYEETYRAEYGPPPQKQPANP